MGWGLEESQELGLGVRVGGSRGAAIVCADWWIVTYFEYHLGELLKNILNTVLQAVITD